MTTTARADEVASRCRRLAAEAQARGLDGVLVHSWRRGAVAWFTGYDPGFVTNQATLWVPATGDPRFGVRFPFESARAERVSGLDVTPGAGPLELVPSGAGRVGVVAGDLAVEELPWTTADRLRARGTVLEDLHDVVDAWRAVKTTDEIQRLAAAGLIGNDSIVAVHHPALVGRTDFEIAADVEAIARSLGASWCRCLLGIGDGAVVTEAGGTTVGPDDPVSFEVTLVADGACTHVNTTAAPGRPVDRRAEEVCRATRRRLIETMGPNVAVDDVVAAGNDELAGADLLGFKEYDFGHGLGQETPEHPRLVSGTAVALAPGMVTAVHVAVRKPGGETAFVGGPIVVTENGIDELVPGAVWTPR